MMVTMTTMMMINNIKNNKTFFIDTKGSESFNTITKTCLSCLQIQILLFPPLSTKTDLNTSEGFV